MTALFVLIAFAVILYVVAQKYSERQARISQHVKAGDIQETPAIPMFKEDSDYPESREYVAIYVDETGRIKREKLKGPRLGIVRMEALRKYGDRLQDVL